MFGSVKLSAVFLCRNASQEDKIHGAYSIVEISRSTTRDND